MEGLLRGEGGGGCSCVKGGGGGVVNLRWTSIPFRESSNTTSRFGL